MKYGIDLIVGITEGSDLPFVNIEYNDKYPFLNHRLRKTKNFNIAEFIRNNNIDSPLSSVPDLTIMIDSIITESLLKKRFDFIESNLKNYLNRIKFSKRLHTSFLQLNEKDRSKFYAQFSILVLQLMSSDLEYFYSSSSSIKCSIVDGDCIEISFNINNKIDLCKIRTLSILGSDIDFVYITGKDTMVRSTINKYYLRQYLKGFCRSMI